MLISQRPVLTEEKIDSARSRFTIEPLEPGFGYTLGNSLRRTLLSSIPGAAVTSVKIDGVLHEFTTIAGVKEDVTDILLNIKGLVLSSDSEDPVVINLNVEGPGVATAGSITPPTGVEIHNPDLHIATLNEQGRLNIEMVVERGRGYVPATMFGSSNEIGRIPVDQIYSPVLKVSYKVEATRVAQRTDYDKLIIDVETKNSMTPGDALASAGKTLVELFGLARELNDAAEGLEIGPSVQETEHIAAYNMPIDDLNFSVRSYNCLKRQEIHTVGELAECSESDLLDIRNFGQKSINEVKIKLANLGLTLKDSPEDFDPSQLEGYDAETGDYVDLDPEESE
ncbi:DNA-directed RNA polymerase subunit alpha [Corynebacterium sp. ES2794-CONJ1]|uniref:DNA-directed RNA polymerase subunit alpha n=1 Tax=unclassified Corynebacterium TaxID=2624378 RepID=UPI0021684320|nr:MULTISPECIES: DNA-directed RNA polymerase subunit alpha [unclassified Corynebacterium]MCS4491395.1 DNA-directed RNA polymerase subunit alpha [Corynebacterium sp. ES2715-CONJ3]MCS4531504.1 DNA-directed RNA polymerase subunit alpha [Corynebacterium sp. ES2730-CONJ]MCU9518892.1 DNA-directed RNA polymerase subunit alpha [Corynebacterium sp. ES2794-CONJ1]